MTYTITPKQGDTVRVRHHKYGICDGIYMGQLCGKEHQVHVNNDVCLAQVDKQRPARKNEYFDRVRFIYPLSLMPKPEVKK